MNFDGSLLDGSSLLFWTNKCHRNHRTLSPKTISCPAALPTTTTNLKRNKEMREKTTTCWKRRAGRHYRTRKHIWPVEWTCFDIMASSLLLIFCLFVCPVIASPSAEPTIQQQQQGGLLPFPEGKFSVFSLQFCLSQHVRTKTLHFLALSLFLKDHFGQQKGNKKTVACTRLIIPR